MRKLAFEVALAIWMCALVGATAQVSHVTSAVAEKEAASAFDVASIRPTTSTEHDHTHIWSSPANGEFRAQNVSITDLLEFAYALPESRFAATGEAKRLLRAARFDLEAKSSPAGDERIRGLAPGAQKTEKQKMVQALLAERFHLETHQETRELPIYTLVVAKGGPSFMASPAKGTSYSMGRGTLTIEGGDSTVEMMAANLANVLERPVLDETGIKGRYLMKLRWMPEDGQAPMLNGAPDTSLPSLFTAVEEQLGLKLVPGKGPVSVLVVDRVEMPSAN